MVRLAQTDPAWEYWDTNAYLATVIAIIFITTVTAWLVVRTRRNAKTEDQRKTR